MNITRIYYTLFQNIKNQHIDKIHNNLDNFRYPHLKILIYHLLMIYDNYFKDSLKLNPLYSTFVL